MKIFWNHHTAEIGEGAIIGKGVKIWHNSQVLGGAVIGENSVIGHNCFVGSRAKIGSGVKIESNTDVWDLITLEDDVFVGPSAVFTNDLTPRAKYPKAKFPQFGAWQPTVVKRGATIGANATIICGVTIGCEAMVGAGAVVTRDVPDNAIALGVPAKIVGYVCECGNRLSEKENGEFVCEVCAKVYENLK